MMGMVVMNVGDTVGDFSFGDDACFIDVDDDDDGENITIIMEYF